MKLFSKDLINKDKYLADENMIFDIVYNMSNTYTHITTIHSGR